MIFSPTGYEFSYISIVGMVASAFPTHHLPKCTHHHAGSNTRPKWGVRIGSVVRCIYVNIQRMVTRLINTFEVQGQQACYVAHLFVHSFCKCVLGTFCGQTWSPIHRWIRWSPCPQSASSRKKSFPKTRRTLSMFFIFTNIEKFDPVIK